MIHIFKKNVKSLIKFFQTGDFVSETFIYVSMANPLFKTASNVFLYIINIYYNYVICLIL